VATAYTRTIANDANITWIIKGWKTKIPERVNPFSWSLQLVRPRTIRSYYGSDYIDFRTCAYYGINTGTFPKQFFGYTDTEMYAIAEWAGFERLKNAAGDHASLGATLAEGKEAFSMIASRATTIYKAARALKRLRFGDFAHELALAEPANKIRRRTQKLGNDLGAVWLEYSYGWKPLFGDIHDAIKSLESPYKEAVIKGNGKFEAISNINLSSGQQLTKGQIKATYRVQYGCTLKVTNPNLAQATQLGLTNPLSVVWEVIPFSFVVDWFTPVGAFLENYSFGYGLSFTRKWATYKKLWVPIGLELGPNAAATLPYPKVVDSSVLCMSERYTDWNYPQSIPKPRFPSFPRDRALNALSLAVTMLSSLQSKVDRNSRR